MCYESRRRDRVQTESSSSNELHDGTIIDISGVLFVFNKMSMFMQKQQEDNLKHYVAQVELLNASRPQCPVLLQGIHFNPLFQDTNEQDLQTWELLQRQYNEGYATSVSLTDKSSLLMESDDDAEELTSLLQRQPYVFPACGHVFGFCEQLKGKSCPLCRKAGI